LPFISSACFVEVTRSVVANLHPGHTTTPDCGGGLTGCAGTDP